jgi:DNA repair exonuclease SbcCD ATPase subunit
LDNFTLTLLGAIGTSLTATVAALWLALNESRKDYNLMRDKMQDKIDDIAEKAIAAINASVNQMNSTAALLVSIPAAIDKQSERWTNLEKEILRILGSNR